MKTKHRQPVATDDDPPMGSIWPAVAVFSGLAVVVFGVMVYVAQDAPEREVAARKPVAKAEERSAPPAAPASPPRPTRPSAPESNPPAPPPLPPAATVDARQSPREPARTTRDTTAPEKTIAAPLPDMSRGNEPPKPEPRESVAVTPFPENPFDEDVEVPVRNDVVSSPPPQVSAPVEPSKTRDDQSGIPDKATIVAKTKEIRQVYKAEYATRDPATRAAFAQRLARDVETTVDDRATAWVLAIEARDQAIQAGDWETFVTVGHLLAERYDIDTHDESITAFGKLPLSPNVSTAWYQGLLDEITSRVESMCDRDDFERAARYASVAKVIATRASDTSIAQEWSLKIKELTTLKIQFGAYKATKETLQSDPSDATANTKWGTYLCLIKGNFQDGLPHLARGEDATLATLAKRDTNPQRDATETVAIADEWWTVGERAKALRPQAWHHAAELYQAARPSLTGLAATKVQKRIDEQAAAAASRGPAGTSLDKQLTTAPWTVQWDGPMRYRGRQTPENQEEWSRNEIITFYPGGRVDSRCFDRFEIRNNVIELYVPHDGDQPPFGGGPPGQQRDRRRHGRAILVGDELRLMYGTMDRMDDPRSRGIGTRQKTE